ncbi:MAG: 4Fe-4S binding protein, partial [Actinobacteria bacterium]|nr:4Fe-4S binding protein [Actinomycetota bacterium]
LRTLMRRDPEGPIEVPARVTVYRTIVHDEERCLGCGACARNCPADAVEARPPRKDDASVCAGEAGA